MYVAGVGFAGYIWRGDCLFLVQIWGNSGVGFGCFSVRGLGVSIAEFGIQ